MESTLNPYLNFGGNAKEAMKFYHLVLGGELNMQTFGEAKLAQTPREKDLIVHATLKSGPMTIMASDTHPSMKLTVGNNVHLSVSGGDAKKLTSAFEQLAKGGKVDMPLAKQFWGDTYGQATDKFGVHWMINITANPQS
ncbi:MAG: VOC family protein [Nitrososphaerota archaeon]|nr:VOC family protein [Nitrososphaerota archaeon]MDG7023552.1 VOC family protein [Nitrososphaerota archaeon]